MRNGEILDVLSSEEAARGAIPRSPRIRLLRSAAPSSVKRLHNLFVFCSPSDLASVSELVTLAHRRHRLRALFLHMTDADLVPQVVSRAGIRTLRNTLVHSDWSVPRRVLNAWLLGAQDVLIANATVWGDRLYVVSCDLETFEIDFRSTSVLRKIRSRQRGAFAIAEDGSYLHWEDSDVHLDLSAIKSLLLPEWRERRVAESLRHARVYGRVIGSFRKAAGLRQADVEGLSARQVRRIEQGAPITVPALRRLAAAHEMSLEQYADCVARQVGANGWRPGTSWARPEARKPD